MGRLRTRCGCCTDGNKSRENQSPKLHESNSGVGWLAIRMSSSNLLDSRILNKAFDMSQHEMIILFWRFLPSHSLISIRA